MLTSMEQNGLNGCVPIEDFIDLADASVSGGEDVSPLQKFPLLTVFSKEQLRARMADGKCGVFVHCHVRRQVLIILWVYAHSLVDPH